jgi:hypothetical protein
MNPPNAPDPQPEPSPPAHLAESAPKPAGSANLSGAASFGAGVDSSTPREVIATPMSRHEAPAPTIDVTARHAPAHAVPPAGVPPASVPFAAAASAPPPHAPPPGFHAASSAAAPPPPPARPAPPPAPHPNAPRRPSRVASVLSHLFLFLVIPTIFLGGVITFFVWQIFGKDNPQLEDQGREALNFQINVAIVTALLAFTCVGLALVPIAWFVAGILAILAAIHAGRGEHYRYPFIVRLVKH